MQRRRDRGNELVVAIAVVGTLAVALTFAIIVTLSSNIDEPSSQDKTNTALVDAQGSETALAGVPEASETAFPTFTLSPTPVPDTAEPSEPPTTIAPTTSVPSPEPPTETPSEVPSETPTEIPTDTPPAETALAAVPSEPPTAADTELPTPSETPAIESSATFTPTPTHTYTPSPTDTAPASPTPTSTYTPTHTETPTFTPTATYTPSETLLPTATFTPLATLTFTPYPSLTPSATPVGEEETDTLSPSGCPVPKGWIAYTIQPGDNLFRLSLRFDLDMDELAEANCINDPSNITAGQLLYVPPDSDITPPEPDNGSSTDDGSAGGLLSFDCDNPTATITQPRPGTVLSGAFALYGSATHPNFQFYRLQISGGGTGGGEFATLMVFDTPVSSGQLGTINTAAFAPGYYWLRLTVVDNTGNYLPQCTVRVQFR